MPPERKIISLLCMVAALRVFVFSAGFPFFNNVDEDAHFDLAIKYSRGQLPRSLEPMSIEAAQFMALYGTMEYFSIPKEFVSHQIPPPLWTLPPEQIERLLPPNLGALSSHTNHESSNPPLYYAAAGSWLTAGRVCGLDGGFLLYWVRFLNVFLIAALVWLGYSAARLVFPERAWLRIGVPLLLAFFPQDIFYSIQSDVLSPLCFGAAFVCLVRWLRDGALSLRLAGFTGLSLAACWLVKSSNVPLVAVAAAAILFKVFRLGKAGKLRAAAPALGLLFASAAVPIGCWMAWSQHAFGDLTGSNVKIEFLGWTRKPFSAWWNHPIFAWHGFWTFWQELMASFWRGEFAWDGRRMASPLIDTLYWLGSPLLIVAAMIGVARKSPGTAPPQRQALWLGFWSFAAAGVFLALISIVFDFGNCFYPSPAYPYFTSGRLMSGALVPFALLFVFGLDRVLGFVKRDRTRLVVLGGIVLAITLSEIILSLPAFASQYNWFHFFL